MESTSDRTEPPVLALNIGLATTRLRSRLRHEQTRVTTGQTMSQLSVLGRIRADGPITASSLARAEHVRAQSIAETIATLKKQGLVEASRDLADGRKTLLSVTESGRRMVDSIVDLRGAWLARVIEKTISPGEREVLAEAMEILLRVADCRLGELSADAWRA
ncbi:MarR family winged helix-turn-helix transcriptional regulator [Nocardia jiangxiensis]|uniref:MarR family winged helix-turn-helix transcriptional regulator n=1 Tax=Nocardia jiangxiensis TaxID=282685 RepID=A0ABW6SC81_9NOCA|nr:MarR family transcriptional regulator [Nocardia jiangxiensis]